MYILKQHSGTGDVGILTPDRGDGEPGIVAEVFSAVAHANERCDGRAMKLAQLFASAPEMLRVLKLIINDGKMSFSTILAAISLAENGASE